MFVEGDDMRRTVKFVWFLGVSELTLLDVLYEGNVGWENWLGTVQIGKSTFMCGI